MTVADILAPLGMRIVVVDTGPLLNDVLRRARQESMTNLVQAARSPAARFFQQVPFMPRCTQVRRLGE